MLFVLLVANTRTNLKLYKEIRSKKTVLCTTETQSKVENKKKGKHKAVCKAAMEDLEAEAKTKFLPSSRQTVEIAKHTVLKHGETKHVVERNDIDVPTAQARLYSDAVRDGLSPRSPNLSHDSMQEA